MTGRSLDFESASAREKLKKMQRKRRRRKKIEITNPSI